jgi:rhodanese-related sulfurtransferase
MISFLRFLNYFYQIGRKSSHRKSQYTLQADNHPPVPASLHFHKNSLISLELSSYDPDFCSLSQVNLIGTEKNDLFVISSGDSYESFSANADELLNPEQTIAVYCKSGRRSRNAAKILVKKGFKVYNLDKGFDNWKELGKEIEQ